MSELIITIILVFTGSMTALLLFQFLFPNFFLNKLNQMEISDEKTFFFARMHSLVVSVIGFLLIYAGFNESIRIPVLLAGIIEKGGLVFFIFKNYNKNYIATGKWYLFQPATLKGDIGVWGSGLEYDKYRKVNGEWLISEMKLEIFFMTSYEQGWHKMKSLS